MYLVWTGDDFGELAFLLILTFDDGFDYRGMVRAQVHEDVCDARFPDGLKEGEGRCVPGPILADEIGVRSSRHLHSVDYSAIEVR